MDNYSSLKTSDIKEFPKPVQAKINELKKRWRIRKVTFSSYAAGWSFIIAEATDYWMYSESTEKSAGFKTQSEMSLHAGGAPISYAIGKRTPQIPGGSWIVEFDIFCGKPMIHVNHVSNPQIS